MYGPTETTIWSAAAAVEAGQGPVHIGYPIANTQFYVLDRERQLVPIGVPGELYIAGLGVAHGYLNKLELTAERFVANPFSTEPDARMYRTGDLVRRHGDGSLEFLCRSDDQVKLRGFRIELGEIEAALAGHLDVAQVAVAMREDVPSDKRLVAYLVPAANAKPSPTSLRDFIVKKLPAYMAPAAYVNLDALPLTPNGKIDRRALPAPDCSKQTRSTEFAAPRSADEQKMSAIWAEVLRLERVGISDNLFELGADSLHVLQIAARARKTGITVTPRQILEHRTIAAIFDALATNAQAKKNELSTIKPVARRKFRLTEPATMQ
jgi:aryl carrier-like protein